MILTTTDFIPGKKVTEILGIVRANTVRTRSLFSDFGAAIVNLVGGRVEAYSNLLTKARNEAFVKLIKEAEKLGADAVINIRFATSSIMQGMAEILVYGTAVKLDDLENQTET